MDRRHHARNAGEISEAERGALDLVLAAISALADIAMVTIVFAAFYWSKT